MSEVSHGDIQRDLGRMEGKSDAMGARLDRLEKIIEDGFAEVRREIGELKAAESQRKGALATLAVVDRKSTRLNSSHIQKSRMPSSA